jgi:hypothetical protein
VKLRLLFISVFLMLVFGSCSDLGHAPVDDPVYYTGTVRDTGSGFFILMSDQQIGPTHMVYPTNLPTEFRRDSLRVIFSGQLGPILPTTFYEYPPFSLSSIQPIEGRREMTTLESGAGVTVREDVRPRIQGPGPSPR